MFRLFTSWLSLLLLFVTTTSVLEIIVDNFETIVTETDNRKLKIRMKSKSRKQPQDIEESEEEEDDEEDNEGHAEGQLTSSALPTSSSRWRQPLQPLPQPPLQSPSRDQEDQCLLEGAAGAPRRCTPT